MRNSGEYEETYQHSSEIKTSCDNHDIIKIDRIKRQFCNHYKKNF